MNVRTLDQGDRGATFLGEEFEKGLWLHTEVEVRGYLRVRLG